MAVGRYAIVAQTGTLALTISLFNRFPVYFILTNIVIVPLSSLVVIIGCLVPLTYPLKFISKPLASLLGFLTSATETLTKKAASLPFSSIENIGMPPLGSFLLFVTLFLFLYCCRQKITGTNIWQFSLFYAGWPSGIFQQRSAELWFLIEQVHGIS